MELLQRDNPRTARLIEYVSLLMEKKAGKAAFLAYEEDLHNTNPFEVNDALDHVLSQSRRCGESCRPYCPVYPCCQQIVGCLSKANLSQGPSALLLRN